MPVLGPAPPAPCRPDDPTVRFDRFRPGLARRGHVESLDASEFLPAGSSRLLGASGRLGASGPGRRHREAALARRFRRGSGAPRSVPGRRRDDATDSEERRDQGCGRPRREPKRDEPEWRIDDERSHQDGDRDRDRDGHGHGAQQGSGGIVPLTSQSRRPVGRGTAARHARGRPTKRGAPIEHLEVGAATRGGIPPPPGRRTEPGRPTTVGSYGP
jgi:hypothetical protein